MENFWSGFIKVSGPIGKAIESIGKHIGLDEISKGRLRSETAKLLSAARKRARRNKGGFSDARMTGISGGNKTEQSAHVNMSSVPRKGELKRWSVGGQKYKDKPDPFNIKYIEKDITRNHDKYRTETRADDKYRARTTGK